MRTGLLELLSEIEEAIQLGETLLLEPSIAPSTPPVLPQTTPALARPAPLPPVPDFSGAGFGTSVWTRALEWSRSASRAESAFLVDVDGLVIATSGPLEAQSVETLAPRLLASLEQMELMEQPYGVFQGISGRFGQHSLTGFLVQLPGNLPLALGLVGPEPVDTGLKTQLETMLAQAFGA